jgi:nucleoid-associated protein YgaU
MTDNNANGGGGGGSSGGGSSGGGAGPGLGAGAAGALIGAAVVVAVMGWFVLTSKPEAPETAAGTAASGVATPVVPAGSGTAPAVPGSAPATEASAAPATGAAPTTSAAEAPAPATMSSGAATSDTALAAPAAAASGEAAESATGTEAGAETAAAAATGTTETPSSAAAAPLSAPKFDTLRAGADGSVLVAGQADAGVAISVAVDGAETAQAETNARGQFATLFSLPPSDQPRIVALTATRGAESRQSEQTLIIAPRSAEEVAAATPPAVTATPPAASGSAEVSGAGSAAAPDAATPAGAAAPAAAPSVLVSDAAGVRVLAAEGSAAVLVIDTISYDNGTDVTVSGRGAGEAGQPGFVRAYLNNTDMALGHVAADGSWSLALKDVAPGTYTLRIDAVSAGGRVTGRAETPFRRETPEVLAAAQPAVPAPGQVAAKVVTVQPGFTLWGIARDTYGDGFLYVRVFDANKGQIRNPDLIYPGQVFALPQ